MLIWGMDTDFILQSLKDIENGNWFKTEFR
jgi:hypothetical protein